MTPALRTQIRSSTGEYRSTNQDAVGASPRTVTIADGVGGRAAGDVASASVTHSVMHALTSRDPGTDGAAGHDEPIGPALLREVLAGANRRIAELSAADPSLVGMSTTFTSITCVGDSALVAHIGDSRAYLVQDGVGRRVTRDDSLVQELVDQGSVAERDAWQHPHRNIILRSLSGSPTDPDHVTLLRIPTRPGDRWLLASDGLTDYVQESVLLTVLTDEPDSAVAADRLLTLALAAEARDNVTLAVIDVVTDAEAEPTPPYVTAGSALSLGRLDTI